MAGNQLGKTLAGSMEVAMHLCGRYPDWWDGRTWDKPVRFWAAGESGLSTRDTIQKLLLGPPQQSELYGTGAIPADAIVDWQLARGQPDLMDNIIVRHGGGGDVQAGESIVLLKSYEQGRVKWQGDTIDGLWCDEEPPLDLYTEGLTRTNATGGMVFITATPLKGMSDVVVRFIMPDANDMGKDDRSVVQMTIDDVEHYSDEERARIVASYPPHEREARAKGVPIMGSGRVFPVSEEAIAIDAITIPRHWARIGAVDFGVDHPFAAIEMAWDKDADILYVTRAYRNRHDVEGVKPPAIHAAAVKPWGEWLPWSWPRDGLQRDKGSGEPLARQYKAHGLKMLQDWAQFDDGSVGVEAGIVEMFERMETGRFKVFRHLDEWFEEFRLYHRKDGMIVKERDDLMSATRYAVMMKRFAKTPPGDTEDRLVANIGTVA